jgi:hypothetical protein
VSSSLIRQAGISATPVIMSTPHSPGSHQTSLRSPSREAAPHSGEREAENMKDGKQRVCCIHEIKNCEKKLTTVDSLYVEDACTKHYVTSTTRKVKHWNFF